jgi:5-deoxy-glucuronate isomerase
MEHLIRPNRNSTTMIEITPDSASWDYLGFNLIALKAGQSYRHRTDQTEAALVPLVGSAILQVADQRFEVMRKGVFEQKPHVLYVPPGHEITVEARSDLEFTLGSAPAEGKYPLRLFRPQEMKSEVRGGGAALRQVNHILAHPLPAERLILFEVYVPGGSWSGWPPHCHDGYKGSPYLEETYYFRAEPETGLALHRNYRVDQEFDEVLPVHDGDLVLVPQGFHSTSAAPGSNLYFLNYLAGELLEDGRATPPYEDPDHVWIKENWDSNRMNLPVFDG